MRVFFIGVDDYLPLAEDLAEYIGVELLKIDEGEAKEFEFNSGDVIYPNYFLEGDLVSLFDYTVVAPHTDISKKWDNKIYQYEHLRVPKPDYTIHTNVFSLISYLLKNKDKKFVITSSYGNEGSASILFDGDHTKVYDKYKSIKEELFRSSVYYENSIGAAVNMIIFKNDIYLAPVTQQKLDGLKYTGGFYPPQITEEAMRKIHYYSSDIGRTLLYDGYLGLCGIDYIVYDDTVLLAELNPRKTGTAVAVSKMLSHSLSVLEYMAISGDFKPVVEVNRFDWEI